MSKKTTIVFSISSRDSWYLFIKIPIAKEINRIGSDKKANPKFLSSQKLETMLTSLLLKSDCKDSFDASCKIISLKRLSILLFTVKRHLPYIFKTNFGSSEEDEVSGFFVLSHLWMRGDFRLG